jgi:hypothetical protein
MAVSPEQAAAAQAALDARFSRLEASVPRQPVPEGWGYAQRRELPSVDAPPPEAPPPEPAPEAPPPQSVPGQFATPMDGAPATGVQLVRPPPPQQGVTRSDLFAKHTVGRDNPNYESVNTWIGQTEKAQAYYDAAQRSAIEEENLTAEEMAAEAARQRAQGEQSLLQAQQAEQIRNRQMDAEMQTTQDYVTEMRRAAQQLSSAAEIDPSRHWASRTAGQKFLAGIGMMLGSAPGSSPGVNPGFEALKDSIRMDIDAQKANFDQDVSAFGARANAVDAQQGMLSALRSKFGDDRAAELALEGARLEQAKRTIDMLLAKGASQQAKAQGEIMKSQLDQAAADVRLQLEQRARANPKTIYKTGYKMGGPLADAYRKVELQKIGAEGKAAEAGAIAGAKAEAELPYKIAEEGAKNEAKNAELDMKERHFRFDQRKAIAGGEKGAAVETALQLTNDYLADYGEDVPGRSEAGIGGEAIISEPSIFGWKPFASEEGQREQSRRETLAHWYATALTGANVSEKQEKFLEKLATDPTLSGDAIRQGLTELKRSLEVYQSTMQRTAEDVAEAEYRGVDPSQMPARDPKTGGRQRSNTGVDAEAAALGGKLR